MANSQESKRSYNSTRRQAQARETRRRIIAAAQKLFIDHGYAGATIEAIAQEAGVAPETVFTTFGNKRTILARVIDVAVGGDDQAVPLLQQPGPQAILHEPAPGHLLRLFATDIVHILERVAPLFEVMRTAAKTEADIAELLAGLLEGRLQNMAIVVEHVAAQTPLRPGLSEAHAAEIVWALSSPELFNLLTKDRGWSKEQVGDWLGDSLVRLLLPEQ